MPAAVAALNRFIRNPHTAPLEFVGFSVEKNNKKNVFAHFEISPSLQRFQLPAKVDYITFVLFTDDSR